MINLEHDNFNSPIYSITFHASNCTEIHDWMVDNFGNFGQWSYTVPKGFKWSMYLLSSGGVRICMRDERHANWCALRWSCQNV